MMTVLLWILLILVAAALLIVASPIRFGADGSFGKSKRAGGRFWLSYIHPLLFAYEYSSRGHKERVIFFGINPRWFRWKKRKRKDDVNIDIPVDKPNSISDTNITTHIDDSSSTGRDNIDIPIDKHDSINDVNNDDNIDNNNDNKDDDDTLMTKLMRRVEHIKDDPIYTKVVDNLSGIRSDFYRYLKNKAHRKKLFKWLRRALNGAFTTVRFDKLKLRAAIGFADPAQTGRMYGYFTAAKSALPPRNKTVRVEMEPVFTEKRLEADIEFSCRTSIAVILSNALILALTFPYKKKKRGRDII